MTASTAEQSQVTQTAEDVSVDAPAFPLSPDSPFPDGYDIGAARDALVDLLAAAHVERSDRRALSCESRRRRCATERMPWCRITRRAGSLKWGT